MSGCVPSHCRQLHCRQLTHAVYLATVNHAAFDDKDIAVLAKTLPKLAMPLKAAKIMSAPSPSHRTWWSSRGRDSTANPTANPTMNPTMNPIMNPAMHPTTNPTTNPKTTVKPAVTPTVNPTMNFWRPKPRPSTNPDTSTNRHWEGGGVVGLAFSLRLGVCHDDDQAGELLGDRGQHRLDGRGVDVDMWLRGPEGERLCLCTV